MRVIQLAAVTCVVMLASSLSGCIMEFAELGEVGAGAAEAGTATLGRAAAGLRLAAEDVQSFEPTISERATFRSMGYDTESVSIKRFVQARALTQTQLTSLLESDVNGLAEVQVGERVYVSLQDGVHTDAGWLRRDGATTTIFNDGTRDLVMSKRAGQVITHYSMRNGQPLLLARTIISDDGIRFDYSVWSSSRNSFLSTGYGLLQSNLRAIRIYGANGAYQGSLTFSGLYRSATAALPHASIVTPIALGSGSVVALATRFQRERDARYGVVEKTVPRDVQTPNGQRRVYDLFIAEDSGGEVVVIFEYPEFLPGQRVLRNGTQVQPVNDRI